MIWVVYQTKLRSPVQILMKQGRFAAPPTPNPTNRRLSRPGNGEPRGEVP